MKSLLPAVQAAVVVAVLARPGDCSALINEKRALLAAGNFAAALRRLEARVAIFRTRPEPWVFLSRLRLLALPGEPEVSQLSPRMGISTKNLELRDWSGLIANLTDERPRFVTGFHGQEMCVLRTGVLAPTLQSS